jgi:DNA-binding transcriptional LysR family regulator
MNIKWLEDFIDLAKTHSFSRSAANRNVTHPAFGRRIKALEDWVGTPLIERGMNPVALTAAGNLFLDAAKNTVQGLYEARLLLREVQIPVSLKIGTGRTLARTFVPGWYEEMYRQCGGFPLSVTTGGTQEAILALAEGKTDLLICYASQQTAALLDPKKYQMFRLGHEVMIPTSAPAKPVKAQGETRAQSQNKARYLLPGSVDAPLPWLSFARGLTLRQVLDGYLASSEKKVHLTPVFQADFYEAVEEMALRGFGMAWLPYRLVKEDLTAGKLCRAGGPEWNVYVDICMFRARSNENLLLDKVWQQTVANVERQSEPAELLPGE